jgi:hypothetical protein
MQDKQAFGIIMYPESCIKNLHFTTVTIKPQEKPDYSNPDYLFKNGFSRRSSPIVDSGPWPE